MSTIFMARSGVSSMSLEWYKAVFEIGGVSLLFLTFVFGAGALIVSGRINRAQAEELRTFQLRIEGEQQKTALAQKEAAEAQKLLAQALTRFARRSGDRIADFNKLVEAFKDKPKKTLEIRFKADDTEAEWFSHDVDRAFQSIGWTVSVRPLKAGERLGGMPLDELRGTTVFSRNAEEQRAFMMPFLHASPFGSQAVGTTAPELPDDTLVIVLGVREKL